MLRQLLGIEKILKRQQHQGEMLQSQQALLLVLGNSLKYSLTAPDILKRSTEYKRCLEIISLLSPMDVQGGKYLRLGRGNDGGYVMLDGFQKGQPDVAYSFGISNDVSWDEAIAQMGIPVFMYDPTIDQLPKTHPNFHFFKTGLTGNKKMAHSQTLGEILVQNKHVQNKNMILKMDVEGCEWDIFNETASQLIGQFSQIVIEFHELSLAVYGQNFYLIVDVLRKINQTHQSIHVHANNYSIPLWLGDLVLPASLEVTYIRKSDVQGKLAMNTRQFPTAIDQPNHANRPDIYLGSFSGN